MSAPEMVFITIAMPANGDITSLHTALVKIAQAEDCEIRAEFRGGRQYYVLQPRPRQTVAVLDDYRRPKIGGGSQCPGAA